MATLLLLLTIFGEIELFEPWEALLGPLIRRLAMKLLFLLKKMNMNNKILRDYNMSNNH
jgi:hypothetical protein